jgi:DNA modification methylase
VSSLFQLPTVRRPPLLIMGDAAHIPLGDGSIHCITTSPPYWGHRDYGELDRDWPAIIYRTLGGVIEIPAMRCQLGLEPTPEAYIGHMLIVFRELRRVLRDDGTCWLNIGDSYANDAKGERGTGKSTLQSGGDYQAAAHPPRLQKGYRDSRFGIKRKDLVGIPWMLAFALRADGWFLRQDIVWAKPNPMPESTLDRCTKAHEYLFLLSKKARYFFDNEAIKSEASRKGCGNRSHKYRDAAAVAVSAGDHGQRTKLGLLPIEAVEQSNKRSVWSIATHSFGGKHFAAFPPRLVEPCIMADTSERGCCPACGAQWLRTVSTSRTFASGSGKSGRPLKGKARGRVQGGGSTGDVRRGPVVRTITTGWIASCSCDAGEPEPCRVFDPFNGAATSMLVARYLGRQGIGLELSWEYIGVQLDRLARPETPRRRVRALKPPIIMPDVPGQKMLFLETIGAN